MDKDIEDHLLERGFKVIMGNMYSSHYTRYETRRSKKGIIGAEVSTWARGDESTFARLGKLYDFIYSANMMWSDAYRENLRFTYDDIIASMLPRIRSRLHGESFPSQAARRTFTMLKVGAARADGTALIPRRAVQTRKRRHGGRPGGARPQVSFRSEDRGWAEIR